MTRLVVLLGDLDPDPPNQSVFELLRWVGRSAGRSSQPVELDVVSMDDGDRRIDLAAQVPVFVVGEKWAPRRFLPSTLQKLRLHRLGALVRSIELRRRFAQPIDVAYLADLDAVPLLHWLPAAIPVFGHLHRVAADQLAELPDEDRALLQARVSRWVAGDAYARERLQEQLGVAPDRVEIHDDFIQPARLWRRPTDHEPSDWWTDTRSQLRDRLGIPMEAPLVCGRGPLDFWFETNSFVRLCWELDHTRPDLGLHFLWIADTSPTDMIWPLRHDLHHAGLDGVAHVLRAELAPRACVAASDVFVRASRHIGTAGLVEEAAALGVPTVKFAADDRSPGLGGQTTVTWPDLDAMVAAVVDRLGQPATRARRTEPARWDVSVGGPLLLRRLRDWAS